LKTDAWNKQLSKSIKQPSGAIQKSHEKLMGGTNKLENQLENLLELSKIHKDNQ